MNGAKLTALRWELGMPQNVFWGKVGVSQTCGSRYEAGRVIPEPVKILLDLIYLNSTAEAVELLKRIKKNG